MSSNKKQKQSSLKSFMVARPSHHSAESQILPNLKPNTSRKRSLSPNVDEPTNRSNKDVDKSIKTKLNSEEPIDLINKYDIDMYTKDMLKHHEVEEILQQIWKPEDNFQFPVSLSCKKKIEISIFMVF